MAAIGVHVCSALNYDFPADWELVLNFFGSHISPGSGRVGYNIEYCIARASGDPIMPPGSWSLGDPPAQASPHLASDQSLNLRKEIADLRDRISSKTVYIDSFTFPSLTKTVDRCIHHLPGDVDQALICLDAPSLLHGIDHDFPPNQDTREPLYQNKKTDISSFALTLHLNFSTVLPEILGESLTVGVEYNGLLLPCANTYKDWFCNENGAMTGVKSQI
jgi:hypothetical protein